MAKVAVKPKKPAGPTPVQLAAAKLAAGSGGNVLEELLKIVDAEKTAEAHEKKVKAVKAYKANLNNLFGYAGGYCGGGKVPYATYSAIKKQLNLLQAYLNECAWAEPDFGLKDLVAKTAKLNKQQYIEFAYKSADSTKSSTYMEMFVASLNQILDIASSDHFAVFAISTNPFEAKAIPAKIENLFKEGLANKALEAAQSMTNVYGQPQITGYYPTSMPAEKSKSTIPDLAAEPTTQKRHGIVSIKYFEDESRDCLEGAVQTAEILCTLSPKRGGFAENKAWMEHKKIVPDSFLRLFFRPCPKAPRHGFVDSRVCVDWDEVEAVYNETIAADPESEVIVMYELEAVASAVATSSMIAVGPGNDGATAGKNSTVYDIRSCEIDKETRNAAKLANGQEGYIEAVNDGKWTYLVQLRGGPATQGNATRMCAKTVQSVRQVVVAEGDGLAWESKMLELGKSDEASTTVIWHPGGSSLSHYAVHALLNELAISFEDSPPSIGDVFEGEKPNMAWDRDAFARGVAMAILDAKAGRLSNKNDLKEAFVFAATGVHSATSLVRDDSAELLGGACATLMLLSAAACCGESRHKENVRHVSGIGTDRHKVFVRALSDYMGARPLLRLSLESFAADTWGSSYGGKAWAICAAMCIDLERVLFDIVRGEGQVSEAVQLSHRLLNAVHNGGKLLNKFGDPSILDYAAKGSRSFAVHSAFRWYAISKGVNILPETKIAEMKARIASSGEFDPGAFEYWNTSSGTFSIDPQASGQPEYEMTDGQAQVRIVDVDSNKVKVQYFFRVNRKTGSGNVVNPALQHLKYKNILSNSQKQDVSNESGYVSLTVFNKELVDAMSQHAQAVGGIETAQSMASSSNLLYVKATSVKPLGGSPKNGVVVYFGDKGVEVKP